MIGYKTSHSNKIASMRTAAFWAFLTWGRRSKGRRSVGHIYGGKQDAS